MAGLFMMPVLPRGRRETSVYRTPLPAIGREFIDNISIVFGVEGKAKDSGSRIVVRDRSGVLEIFEASGSIWWTRKSSTRSEPRKSVSFLSEKEAIAKADSYLEAAGLADKKARPNSVTYAATLFETKKDREPSEAVTQQHVNYEFSLDDLPVWGPGAKIQVTFGEDNQVVEVLKFWREPKKEQEKYELISAETATKIFQNHEAFSDLSERTAKVQVDDIALGHYALPPREMQAYLVPVYRFKGFVSTEHLERYEFAKHVIAVHVAADQLKRIGGMITGAPAVI